MIPLRLKLIGQVCEAVAQVSDAEWEGVRAVYLKKHPDAFWVGLGSLPCRNINHLR